MRSSTIVMIAVAAVFGLLAVFVAQTWLNSQAEARLQGLRRPARARPVAARTLVVAAKPLRFGNELTAELLREVPWPEGTLPTGAYAQDRRRAVRRQARRAHRDRKQRAGAGHEDHRPRTARDAVGAGRARHEGGHHPRQRRRRRRRLRAAGRSRRHRADAPGKGQRVLAGPAAGRARAGDRPDRRRARLQSDRSEIGDGRGRHASPARSSGWPRRSARCRCCCARRARPRRSTPRASPQGSVRRNHRRHGPQATRPRSSSRAGLRRRNDTGCRWKTPRRNALATAAPTRRGLSRQVGPGEARKVTGRGE